MKFGRIDKAGEVHLDLPSYPHREQGNRHFLEENQRKWSQTFPSWNLWAGCPVWADKEFATHVYPEGTKPKDYLRAYAARFSALEVNSTFYGVPSRERIQIWKSQVREFRFCPKFPRSIHQMSDKEILQVIDAFKLLGDSLGPVLLQMPSHFFPTLKNRKHLARLLQIGSSHVPVALELRHPDWFRDQAQLRRLVHYLRPRNISLVMTDTPGRRDVLHMYLTSPYCLIRFVGQDLIPSDFQRIDQWAEMLSYWRRLGLKEAYMFMHQPTESNGANLVDYLNAQTQSSNEPSIS